ncbi:MAG: beta-propeller domain-containing protein [archaeon]
MESDKFIMIGLEDERSKKVAHILGNKTCKKIIDYLSETKEASEKDIADALGIPLNTTEYNLNKLIHAGLVDKTKNFFWSKRGKKIPMYKLARKHIVISPRSSPSMTALKAIIPVVAVIAAALLIMNLIPPNVPPEVEKQEMNKFNSIDELKDFLKENTVEEGWGRGGIMDFASKGVASTTGSAESAQADSASDYSETNIQVEGVDEADIIKNDGKYIYTVSGNKVVIVNAYPAEDMEVLSEIEFKDESITGIFINGGKLVVFSQEYAPIIYEAKVRCMAIGCVVPQKEQVTNVYIYDISDREYPGLEEDISVSGYYSNSRMIGDYVYIINNQYIYDKGILPAVETDGAVDVIEATEISYSDIKDTSFQYTIILAVNVQTGETSEETMLTGRSQNIYVSQDNIYTTFTKYAQWYSPVFRVDGDEDEREKTIINKFSIDEDEINYEATGEVLGHILNQFSMDEYEGNFRIATTISGYEDNKDTSINNIYVLNEDMEVVGELEGIAPGESIYSVRFMGKRGYIVTFRHIDPLFVIDLSNPENPEILGKLKIPGYSDYLHPYDETHLIGIGKEVDASIDADKVHTEGAVYYTAIQGVKLAIFDVSDVEHPVEMYKVVIGDRGTESLAASDHKAFLFDKARELLVVPMTVAELQEGQTKDMQGEYTFQGAYVYNINLEDGFDLKGRVTHYDEDDEAFKKSGYYFRGDRNIQRSLYMDDVLYTFSNEVIKANDLEDLDEINFVELPYEDNVYYGYGSEGIVEPGVGGGGSCC